MKQLLNHLTRLLTGKGDAEKQAALPPAAALPIRALVADDHFVFRNIVFNAMKACGISHVDVAKDGKEVREAMDLALANQQTYDLFVLDWHMPFFEGPELVDTIRQTPHFAKSAIVMISAESGLQEVTSAMKKGVTNFITKPLAQAEVEKKLRAVLAWMEQQK